jgi:act minimal PKS acyl carrier protein
MTRAAMTPDDLRRLLNDCAGEGGGEEEVRADTLDTPFTDLGYDSLALMEMAAQVSRRFGISVEEESLAEQRTPRAVLDMVNGELAAADTP